MTGASSAPDTSGTSEESFSSLLSIEGKAFLDNFFNKKLDYITTTFFCVTIRTIVL